MEEPGQLKQAFINATAGAISGAVSRTVTSPLDVIKIRFQVQLEPTSSWTLLRKDVYGASKYTGMLQATKDIFREEGLRGFWRGNVPALLMVMPYTSIQFTVLHKLKTFAAGSSRAEDHTHLSPYLSYISGALAGCAATVGSYPFDLIRTILASQGEPKVYKNMRSALVDIIKTRGFRGLYAGLSPTLVEIVPYAGLQFGTYDTFKRWATKWNQQRFSNATRADESISSFQLFLCGFAAGTCAKAVCHPLDVVKKRFQVEGLQRHPRYGARVEHRAYKNMFDALGRILNMEGWAGLYKGIIPSIIKAAPAGAVTFVAYEFTSDWKIFIGGLPKDTQYSAFVEHFEKYGEITDSVIMKDEHTNEPMGFGFITYADPSIVDTIIADTHFFNGKQVEVKRTVPNRSSRKDLKTKKIFVGGLPSSLTEDELENFFSKYGVVVEHKIICDYDTNRSRGFGFVIFETEEVVDEVLSNGNMIDMMDTQVEVVKVAPKT